MNILLLLKHFYQRRTRGFDDTELWDLDQAFANWVLPRLRVFRDGMHSSPSELTEKAWREIINKMIVGFQTRTEFTWWFEREEESEKKYQEAIDLFSIYIRHLWT